MHRMPLLTAFAVLVVVPTAYAQERSSGATSTYRLEYNIHDGSDASKPGRRYTQTIEPNGKAVFRVGDKVPYTVAVSAPGTTQYNYADVGVNIDSRIHDSGDKILLNADMELSTIAQRERGAGNSPLTPTISSLHLSLGAALTPGKRILIASIDDPVTTRKFDVEATITKVD